MIEPGHGHIILYSYLWAREYDRGEESGRKARPTCVMLIVGGKDGRRKTLLFQGRTIAYAVEGSALILPFQGRCQP